ncbi:MAG TPA: hypothetical protein D7H79_01200 [Candidatus Poseidoniales archaeon]|nr:MAG TPA: hypothetical protein D7H79_01200 [Candidatus Poseidoniales archaeon]
MDAMKDRLEVASLDHPDCLVSKHLRTFASSPEASEIELVIESVDSLEAGLSALVEVECDLLALPARLLHGKQVEMLQAGCKVVGSRTPRRPARVLVSENKLWYQPRGAIILADSQLIRRQLRRARRGLRVLSPKAYAGIHEIDLPDGNSESLAIWMESLRADGSIDGFVASRDVYDSIRPDGRRHVLGVDAIDRGSDIFLPIAYADLIVFIGRNAFPFRLSNLISEKEGESAWWIQNHLIGAVPEEEIDRVGILVRHRQVGTIMRKAQEFFDLAMENAFHDPEGDVPDTAVHVETHIEVISKNGLRTLSMERVMPFTLLESATITMLKDWEILLKNTTANLPEHPREGPASDAWLNLED